MLLRMVSLYFLDKVAKRIATIFFHDCFDEDQTSPNITRIYSNPFDSLKKVAKRLDFCLDFVVECNVKWKFKSFGSGLRSLVQFLVSKSNRSCRQGVVQIECF